MHLAPGALLLQFRVQFADTRLPFLNLCVGGFRPARGIGHERRLRGDSRKSVPWYIYYAKPL